MQNGNESPRDETRCIEATEEDKARNRRSCGERLASKWSIWKNTRKTLQNALWEMCEISQLQLELLGGRAEAGHSAVEQLFGRLLSALLKNLNFHFLLQIGGENL